jgi:hypothetical protein
MCPMVGISPNDTASAGASLATTRAFNPLQRHAGQRSGGGAQKIAFHLISEQLNMKPSFRIHMATRRTI